MGILPEVSPLLSPDRSGWMSEPFGVDLYDFIDNLAGATLKICSNGSFKTIMVRQAGSWCLMRKKLAKICSSRMGNIALTEVS